MYLIWDTIRVKEEGGINMSKAGFIRARTDLTTKHKAEHIFKSLGLTTTQAITVFYKQVILQHGMPFDVKIPNAKTLKVFNDTDKKKNITKWKDTKSYLKKMGIK